MSKEILSTLGLCKRAGMLEVGEESVESSTRSRDVRLLLLACDAAENTARRAAHFSEVGQCLQIQVPFTKEELGLAVGRGDCALLAVTDVGFAASIARRLADENAETYGDTADRLAVKAQRAALRKTEEALHEKNLRRGKKRKPGEQKAAEYPAKPTAPANPGASGDRKPYGKPGASGDRKPYGKPGESGDRKPYGKPGGFGDRKPYGKPGGGGRGPRPFAHSHPVSHGKGSFPKKGS